MDDKVLNKLDELQLEINQLKDLTIESNTDIDNIIKSQSDLLKHIHNSDKAAKANLKKELKQLQGLLVVVIAGLIFFFGIEDKQKRDEVILTNIKEIITGGIALAGGYKVLMAKKEAEEEDTSLPSDPRY